ncbi:hypothetical protein Ct61P_05712 [Colletotrichum tofieldiae]|nr:hypothetical protein Ct61P_05712 [Colletotrichum tofieldiae]
MFADRWNPRRAYRGNYHGNYRGNYRENHRGRFHNLRGRNNFPRDNNRDTHGQRSNTGVDQVVELDVPRRRSPFLRKVVIPENERGVIRTRTGLESLHRAPNARCDSCGHYGHRLIDCAFPDLSGNIGGCFLCNDKSHDWCQCTHPLKDTLTWDQLYDALVGGRFGKPTFRLPFAWYLMVEKLVRQTHRTPSYGVHGPFPMSTKFAKKMWEGKITGPDGRPHKVWENYDYISGEGPIADKRKFLCADPSTNSHNDVVQNRKLLEKDVYAPKDYIALDAYFETDLEDQRESRNGDFNVVDQQQDPEYPSIKPWTQQSVLGGDAIPPDQEALGFDPPGALACLMRPQGYLTAVSWTSPRFSHPAHHTSDPLTPAMPPKATKATIARKATNASSAGGSSNATGVNTLNVDDATDAADAGNDEEPMPTVDATCKITKEPWQKFENRLDAIRQKEIELGFKDEIPSLSKEGFEALFPEMYPEEAYNETWSREDEKALLQAWQNDPRRKNPMRKNDSSLTKCFKVIARIFKVSPLEIVSPKYHLEWDTTAKGVTGPHWSENFSARLARIATHPIWEKDVKLLALALQYVVILRTKDRRPWLFSKPSDQPLFVNFQQVLEELSGQKKKISFIHKEVRDRLRRAGHNVPAFSAFLLSLEKQTHQEHTAVADESKRVYAVRAADLQVVMDGLDQTANLGFPIYLPVEYFGNVVFDNRGNTQDDPPSVKDMPKYMTRSWLNYRRIEARIQKAEESGNISSGEDQPRPDASANGAEMQKLREENKRLHASNQTQSDRVRELEAQNAEALKAENQRLKEELAQQLVGSSQTVEYDGDFDLSTQHGPGDHPSNQEEEETPDVEMTNSSQNETRVIQPSVAQLGEDFGLTPRWPRCSYRRTQWVKSLHFS